VVSVGTQTAFLLCGSLLAFMTRKTKNDINETNTVAILIYSNFICVLLRTILVLLVNTIDATLWNLSQSVILSVDVLASIIIYFVPKFLESEHDNNNNNNNNNYGRQKRRSSRLENFSIQNMGWGNPTSTTPRTSTRFSFLRKSYASGSGSNKNRDTSGRCGATMGSYGATYGADTETGTGTTDVLNSSVLVSENPRSALYSEPPAAAQSSEPSQSETAIETEPEPEPETTPNSEEILNDMEGILERAIETDTPNSNEILNDIEGIGLITDAFDTINDTTSTMCVVPKK